MVKQLFYIAAVVVLVIVAYRLMKKVDSNPFDDPYKLPERSEEALGELDDDDEAINDVTIDEESEQEDNK